MQYTALAWSRKGFPSRALRLIRYIKKNGARCAIVFHDAEPYDGNRWRDRLRRAVQLFVMRESLRRCDLAILTVPREKISWIPARAKNVVHIPVGANLPAPEKAWTQERTTTDSTPVIAVFTVTSGRAGDDELQRIAEAAKYAANQVGRLKILLLGRNSELAAEDLKKNLARDNVEVRGLGLLPADEVVRTLGAADVFLFVRAPISSRRGSALAGIACGLPVIAREGSETAPPITEAGLVLLPRHATSEYGPALVKVLTDHAFRASLAKRSRNAQDNYFSWQVIAEQYAAAIKSHS